MGYEGMECDRLAEDEEEDPEEELDHWRLTEMMRRIPAAVAVC